MTPRPCERHADSGFVGAVPGCPDCDCIPPPGYLLVSEAELATALHRAGWGCDAVKPLAPTHYEADHADEAHAVFAALVAAQEKGA